MCVSVRTRRDDKSAARGGASELLHLRSMKRCASLSFPHPTVSLLLLRASFVPLLCRSVARRQSDGSLMCFLSAAAVVPLSSCTFHLPVPIFSVFFFVAPNSKTSKKKKKKSSSNSRKLKRVAVVVIGAEDGGGGGSILLSDNFQPLLNKFSEADQHSRCRRMMSLGSLFENTSKIFCRRKCFLTLQVRRGLI